VNSAVFPVDAVSHIVLTRVSIQPIQINAWVSGDVAAAVLGATTWQWGIGMWAIIVSVLPQRHEIVVLHPVS
jgi:SIT family siderophore-iron:H+ symporter-like MFS transporter